MVSSGTLTVIAAYAPAVSLSNFCVKVVYEI